MGRPSSVSVSCHFLSVFAGRRWVEIFASQKQAMAYFSFPGKSLEAQRPAKIPGHAFYKSKLNSCIQQFHSTVPSTERFIGLQAV